MLYSTRGMSASSGFSTGNLVWLIIAAVLAVVGGIVVYFTFLSKKNEGKFTGFLGWLYDFLTFKKMTIEHILKITYLIIAAFITLASFAFISNILVFFNILVLGNLVVRMMYEGFLVVLVICRNTTEINKKMGKTEVVKEDKKEEK